MKFKNIIFTICLILVLFTAISFVSAETIANDNITNVTELSSETNLNTDLNESINQRENISSTAEVNKIVKVKTKIIAVNKSFIPKSGKYYTITLKDAKNNPLVGKNIKITLNKKTYTKKTNSKGQVAIKISLSTQKKYLIKIKFKGTKNYYKSSAKKYIIIKKEATKIVASAFTCKAKTKVNYKIALKNKNNNIIKNKQIILTTNGKTYKKTTNNKGEAIFTLTMPSAYEVEKVYNTKIKFSGDTGYIKSSKTIPITVISKENMFITAKNMTVLSNNESYYEFRIYGNGNYSEKPVQVTITGNNLKKVYNLTTNETGYSGFNFKEAYGIYKVNIKFAEDEVYKSASKDVIFVSSKETTYVKSSDIIQAASTLKTYVDKNLKLPSSVKVGNTTYSTVDFAYMSGALINSIYNGYDEDLLIEAPNLVSLKTESLVVSKTLNKTSYNSVIAKFIKTCEDNYKNYNIREIPSSINFKDSGITYSTDFKTYLYTYSNILTTYQKTNQLPAKIIFKSSTYCPKTITMSNIIKAAKTVASNIDTGKQVNPKSIKINGYWYSADEFTYLISKTIINIKNKKTSNIALIEVSDVKSVGTWKTIKLTKKQYLSLASTLVSKISKTNTLPATIKTSKGYADLEFYVYALSNTLKYYSSKKALPSTSAVNTVFMYLTGDDFKHGFNERNKETDLDKYLKTSGQSAINSEIKKLATKLTKGKSTWNKVKAIFNYVRNHVSYRTYYNSKNGAIKTLKTKKANCCDQTNLMIALLRSAGIRARYSHSHYCHFKNGYVTGHVWGQALVGNVWVKLDPISGKNTIGKFYNINQKKTSAKTIKTYALIPF